MTNDFMLLEYAVSESGRGGAYMAKANFKLDNIKAPVFGIPVKIDTGCSVSTIPMMRLHISESKCDSLKREDILNEVDYLLSYGVESGGCKHEIPRTFDEKMQCTAMKFKHKVSSFSMGGVDIPVADIYVNYNRRGNVLIGMDILEKFDIHIGKSMVLEKDILLACPKDKISKKYKNALKNHFGLTL